MAIQPRVAAFKENSFPITGSATLTEDTKKGVRNEANIPAVRAIRCPARSFDLEPLSAFSELIFACSPGTSETATNDVSSNIQMDCYKIMIYSKQEKQDVPGAITSALFFFC